MFPVDSITNRRSIKQPYCAEYNRGRLTPPHRPTIESFFASLSIFLLAAFLVSGCEEQSTGTLDPSPIVPFSQGLTVTPDSTNIDTLISVNGVYEVETTVNVRVSHANGLSNIARVQLMVLRPSSSSAFLVTTLHDDGQFPDGVAGDGIYAARIVFPATRPQAGRYRMQVIATDLDGHESSMVEGSMFITRNNSRPLLQNVVAPDTVVRPASGSTLLFFSATVSDSDGYGDINEVFFQRVQPAPGGAILMFDDGNQESSGDQVAGDGIFSRIVRIDSTAILGNQVFVFLARDRFGAQSDSTLHSITILPSSDHVPQRP